MKKKGIILGIIIIVVVIIIFGVISALDNSQSMAKEVYNKLEKVHSENIKLCSEVYDCWAYTKTKRGGWDNTLYQQLEREHNIPYEYVLEYYGKTEKYNEKDEQGYINTYEQIKILNEIDENLENDMVFVFLDYYKKDVEEINLTLAEIKNNLKKIKKNCEYYDILVDWYTSEAKATDFINNPKGNLLDLNNMIESNVEIYENILPKLQIEFE